MGIPRFQIRTLMIVVVIAGFECWTLVNFPAMGAFILGPLIGSFLMRLCVRDLVVGSLCGGVVGGVCEVVFFGVLLESDEHLKSNGLSPGWDLYCAWLFMAAFVGMLVGLTSLSLEVLRSAIIEKATSAPGPASFGSRILLRICR
ncbi:hypothetical protein SAMN05444166_3598 [Singulisphaera sp. GP187]|nr:hypothetical protein SAMN05444166_3598 [Singulisphaera sp. GP187]